MKNFAICLCFKNASSYLAEWLAFYRALGADYFYLYDNNSTDDYSAQVSPYLKQGLAELRRWPGLGQQNSIYIDCLKRARRKVRWLAFLDDDEFLWPVLDPDLPTAIDRYAAYAGVGICWFLYGSSHHQTRPPGLVIENFTWRARRPDSHVKCIVSPIRVTRPLEIGHAFECEPGFTMVDEQSRVLTSSSIGAPSGDLLRVNHYATKSLEELRQRRTQPQADTGNVSVHALSLWEHWAEDWNKTQDVGIHRFLPKVREVMREMAAFNTSATVPAKNVSSARQITAALSKPAASLRSLIKRLC